jgi:predicted membrane-bound spermidine synthase
VSVAATIRDIAIIIIAVQTIVIGVLIGILIWQIWRLIKMIQTEIKPVIEDAQDTVKTVRATALFVSDSVVEPTVKTSGKVAGAVAVWRSLTSELRASRRQTPHVKRTPASTAEHPQS